MKKKDQRARKKGKVNRHIKLEDSNKSEHNTYKTKNKHTIMNNVDPNKKSGESRRVSSYFLLKDTCCIVHFPIRHFRVQEKVSWDHSFHTEKASSLFLVYLANSWEKVSLYP